MSSAPIMSTICMSKRDHQRAGKRLTVMLRGTLTALIATSSLIASIPPILIKDPESGREEQQRGEHHNDDHQNPGHRRSIAHLVIAEPHLVEIERIEEGGIGGTAIRHDQS